MAKDIGTGQEIDRAAARLEAVRIRIDELTAERTELADRAAKLHEERVELEAQLQFLRDRLARELARG